MIDRRAFLRYGALGGALAAVDGAAAREPLDAVPQGAPTPERPAIPAFDLEEVTIAELQRRMESGQESARSIADKYLARIAALDKRGPALNQILETNPDAVAIAERLDEERKRTGPRGPLHGIPVLLKDNIGTADRMTTTAGSLALEGSIPARDAFIAARLRDAGAVLLGKTNMSEWANFRSTRSTSGWSGRGGLGRNPYALDRNSSGSSSGSGAAIAASFAAVSVGTETDGSIVSPASTTGLVGIKPTLGLISRAGIIPIAHSQDTAGPMARTVTDAAILLGALAGVDPDDPETRKRTRRGQADYTRFLDPDGLKGARLGIVRKHLFGYSASADRLAESAIADLKRLGAVIVDPADVPNADAFRDSEFEVLLYEFKADLNKYLLALGDTARVRSLADVIAFNDQHKDVELPYFGQEILLMAEKKGPLTSTKYRTALAKNLRLTRTLGIDAVMNRHRLDALVAPTSGPAWLTDLVNGDSVSGGSSSIPAVAGYPHITVPAGYVRGLPVGLSFFGRAYSEPALIRIAYAFEQATRHRQPPRFLAAVDLSR